MAKVKVQVNGKEEEVDLPQGFKSVDEIKAEFIAKDAVEQLITDRLARHTRSVKKEFLEDVEFRADALKAWNIKPNDGKGTNGATPDEAIKAAIEEADRTRYAPLKSDNESLKEKIASLVRSQLHSQILSEAAAVNVAKQYLKPIAGAKVPAIVRMFEDAFGFDEQNNDWLLKQADGKSWAVSGEANAAHPYKGVRHFFADLVKDPEMRNFFEPQQKGADLKTGTPGGKSTVSRSDPVAMGANAEKILKGEVDVVD